jgi:Domain of unknown function (DUF4191)
MSTPVAPEDLSRRQQIVQTYKMTRKSDPRIWLWLLLAFVVAGAVGFGLFSLLPGPGLIFAIPGALLFGLLAVVIIFGRRAQRAAYAQMEGQTGSAAAALRMLRRGWKTDPVIAFNKQQDIVHRVVGPPGIVLIGEGNPGRVKALLANERRKHERVVSETPVHEIVCGNGPDEVPLTKLVRHVTKLGKAVKPSDLTDILNRLKALDANRSPMPIPKGPIPTSMKGSRQNMRGR